MRTRRLALCVSLLVAVGCVDQIPTVPTANALIVHAVLDLGSRDQYIMIESTTGAIDEQRSVTGAVVTITTPDGNGLLAEEMLDSTHYTRFHCSAFECGAAVSTVYRVSLERYGIDLVPGGTYRLSVTTPDGREVSGTTKIPNAVLDTASTTLTIGPSDTVRMSVPRIADATAYEVSASWYRTTFFNDTAVAVPPPFSAYPIDFGPPPPNRLVVSAVDQNYYDYFRRASDPWTGSGLISHLDGAIGVFGSIVPVLRRTVIVQ